MQSLHCGAAEMAAKYDIPQIFGDYREMIAKAELDALWAMLKLSIAEAAGNEGGMPGVGASAVKLFYTELYQRVTEVAIRLAGRAALSRSDVADFPNEHFVAKHMNSLSLTIAAGSSQIQRNIISERILGLPRER